MKEFIAQNGFIYEVTRVDPYSRCRPCMYCPLYDHIHNTCLLDPSNGRCNENFNLVRAGKLLNTVEDYE